MDRVLTFIGGPL